MKPTFQFMLIMLCLFNFGVVFAQNEKAPRDTIHFQSKEKLEIYILAPDYHNLTKDEKLQTILLDFQSRLKEIRDKIPTASAYTIEYNYLEKMEVLQSTKIAGFTISDEKAIIRDFQNQVIITDPNSNYQVNIGFDELDVLLGEDFNKLKLTQNRPSGYLDMLSLQAGVGANVYRSKFLTDITGEISLQLNQKGILRNQFYLSNNLMFSFDESNSAVINNFTNIGYRRNLSNERGKPNWLGIEIGTVTKRSGDIFQSNTMRLGMNWQVGKHITVSPQMYFNGFFKQVSPGLRIGIGL